jgi:hypothetical protein
LFTKKILFFFKNLLTNARACGIIISERKREVNKMKKWFEEVKDWFYWNSEAVFVAVVITLVVAIVVSLLVVAFNSENVNGSADWIASWVANPANPASPIHNILP